MELFQYAKDILVIILYILASLGIGKLLLIILLKQVFPKASIKQVENFVKNTNVIISRKSKNNIDGT